MTVLQEILEWSLDRPLWQRDALRRLVQNYRLEESDLDDLTEICKAEQGLANKTTVIPLKKEHLPTDGDDNTKVTVQSVHHLCGVNALAEDQTLTFGVGLTVVYGDNAAGKSGYTRILKKAFRARGAEDILGNILSGSVPPTPSVSIKYTIGDDGTSKEWTGEEEDDALSRVSVFDTHSASVYLKEKTDVAFRPFGLDLFDKLSQACSGVKSRLERERNALQDGGLFQLQAPEGTQVAELLVGLTSLTNPDTVKKIATLSVEERGQITLLEKQLTDLDANDPSRLARELNLKAGRLRTLKNHIDKLEREIATEAIEALEKALADMQTKDATAQRIRSNTLSPDLLPVDRFPEYHFHDTKCFVHRCWGARGQ